MPKIAGKVLLMCPCLFAHTSSVPKPSAASLPMDKFHNINAFIDTFQHLSTLIMYAEECGCIYKMDKRKLSVGFC